MAIPIQKHIRVMIVDDNLMFRIGMRAFIGLQPDMRVIAEAADGERAVEMFRLHKPDVTLMDMLLPGMNGIETIVAIRGEYPASQFIMLSTLYDNMNVMRAQRAGASNYLLKGCCDNELLSAIRSVANATV
jgi:DNA-binding NarL/FixJ family response regulator